MTVKPFLQRILRRTAYWRGPDHSTAHRPSSGLETKQEENQEENMVRQRTSVKRKKTAPKHLTMARFHTRAARRRSYQNDTTDIPFPGYGQPTRAFFIHGNLWKKKTPIASISGPSSALSYAEGLGAQDLQLQAQNRGAHPITLRCAPRTRGCARH